MGQFDALEIGLEVIRSLVEVMPGIKRQDADLERHIRRAASSVPMNLGEGNRRVGKDRLHFFRIAAGSADEVRTGPRGCFKSSPSDRGRARSSWARSEEARRELAQRRDTNGGYRRRRATQIHGLRSRPNPG